MYYWQVAYGRTNVHAPCFDMRVTPLCVLLIYPLDYSLKKMSMHLALTLSAEWMNFDLEFCLYKLSTNYAVGSWLYLLINLWDWKAFR